MALFRSIWDDMRHTFRIGNMTMRLIFFNFGVFVLVKLVYLLLAFGQTQEVAVANLDTGLTWFCLPASGETLLFQPWSLVTHMFLHENFIHILGNLFFLYLFGGIVGDLIGNKRILPVYLLGGVFGGLMFMASAQVLWYVGSYALGASGAVMALGGAALTSSPDYRVRLFLVGELKVKYIVLVLLLVDLVGIADKYNSGGHIAHLGGFAMGCLVVYRLRDGHDWSEPINRALERLGRWLRPGTGFQTASKGRKNFSGGFGTVRGGRAPSDAADQAYQERLNAIRDKIKQSGFESLSAEEKEFLYNAGRK